MLKYILTFILLSGSSCSHKEEPWIFLTPRLVPPIKCSSCRGGLTHPELISVDNPAQLENACSESAELWITFHLSLCEPDADKKCFDVCLGNFCVEGPLAMSEGCRNCIDYSSKEYLDCWNDMSWK